MSEIRVFELAKEFNLPAKQMVQQLRKGGIAVEKPFDHLTDEQVVLARKLMAAPEPKTSPTKVRTARRVISTRRTSEPAPEAPPEEGDEEKPRIITVTAKNVQEHEEERPRRIRRKSVDPEAEASPEDSEAQEAEAPEAAPAEEAPVKVKVKDPAAEPEAPAAAEAPPEPEAPAAPKETPEPAPKAQAAEPAKAEAPAPAQEAPQPEPKKAKPAEAPAAKPEPVADSKSKRDAKPAARPDRKAGKPDREKQDADGEEDVKSAANKKTGDKKRQFRDYYSSDEDGRRRRKDRGRSRARRGGIDVDEAPKHTFNPRRKSIKIGNQVTLSELAGLLGVKATELIKKLMLMGVMATVNQNIPGETAVLLAAEFGIDVEFEAFELEDLVKEDTPEEEEMESRAPIVTIMGHVDHGKTSLLDTIRSTQIADREAGGITQHIGAYHVEAGGFNITFLDTPGHQAFSAMRARGATVTDLVVLVVAADDRVQPQTIEAINHAKAADVPIIVAVNKVDRPEADPNRIRQELLSHELVPEEYGGSTIFVDVSAKAGTGIDNLLEMIQLQAEVLELTSTAQGNARGTIIESRISRGQGAVATVLVQRGTLKVGDFFVVGSTYGRVRAMFNDRGKSVKEVTPALPAEISGLNDVPEVGEQFVVLADEKAARQLADERLQRQREQAISAQQKTTLENLFTQMGENEQLELKVVVKADVQGSAEALQNAIAQLGTEKVTVRFIHSGVGNVTETDVTLASASDAIIIGFNVNLDAKGKEAKSREGVDVRLYTVIYDAIDDVRAAMEGLLAPEIREEVIGHCEIRAIFSSAKQGMVFGGLVTDGKITRNGLARVLRNNKVVYNGHIASLKRFKDDVREVAQNYECGIVMDFPEIEVGDVVEVFERVEEAAKL